MLNPAALECGKAKANCGDFWLRLLNNETFQDYNDLDEAYFKSITAPHALLVDVKGTYRNKIKELNYWSL